VKRDHQLTYVLVYASHTKITQDHQFNCLA
jgi:hypothetical protein